MAYWLFGRLFDLWLFIVAPFYALWAIKASYIIWLLWVLVVFLCACYAALLCALIVLVNKTIKNSFMRSCLVLLCMDAFFWWIDQYSLLPFGAAEGICFVNPLIPAAKMFMPETLDAFQYGIGIVRTEYAPCQPVDVECCMHDFFRHVAIERERHPQISCIVTPESALPFVLNNHPEQMAACADYARSLPLLIGSFYEEEGCICNALYWFSAGRLQKVIRKQHALMVTESIPRWCDCAALRELFVGEHSFAVVAEVREPLELVEGVFFYPLLCSELFCTDMIIHVPEGAHVLALVNDSWFGNSSLAENLRAYARMKAWWQGKKMIYISNVF